MTRDAHHRRANEKDVWPLRQELQGLPAYDGRAVMLAAVALATAVALCAWLGWPLLPLAVSGSLCVTLAAVLKHYGWSVPWRWATGIGAGLVALVALVT